METLSNGFKNPENGDRGSVFFPALNENIEQINEHNHDGNNSERINAQELQKATQNILAAAWGADAGGSTYTQAITCPSGFTFNDMAVKFHVSGGAYDGAQIYPTIVKTGASAYNLTVNDNTLTLVATYG